MTDQYVEELIRKYAEKTATPEEVNKLLDWYRSAPVRDVPWPAAQAAEQQQVYDRMLQRLRRGMASPKKAPRLSWLRVAALLVLVVGAALLVLLFSNPFAPQFITVANPSVPVFDATLSAEFAMLRIVSVCPANPALAMMRLP